MAFHKTKAVRHALVELTDGENVTWLIRRIGATEPVMAETFARAAARMPRMLSSIRVFMPRMGMSDIGTMIEWVPEGPDELSPSVKRDIEFFYKLHFPTMRLEVHDRSDRLKYEGPITGYLAIHNTYRIAEVEAHLLKRMKARDRQKQRRLEADRDQADLAKANKEREKMYKEMSPARREKLERKRIEDQAEFDRRMAEPSVTVRKKK